MRIPFTDAEFVMLDGFKDASYFMGILFLSVSIIGLLVENINIDNLFGLGLIGLISISLSWWFPTVSLFEFWELKKQYKLKKLEEWRK